VATGRASKLWGVAIGALTLAGCSAGQTVAPTTEIGIVPTTRVSTTTTEALATGAVTGEACGSQDTSQPQVTVDLDKLPVGGSFTTLKADTVTVNNNYRFTSVAPGRYVLLGLWPSNPSDETVIHIVADETRVVNLGACMPTIGSDYKKASQGNVRQFLARASMGDDQTFSATYRFLTGGSYSSYDSQIAGQTFSFAQEPHGGPRSMQVWGAGDFAYLSTYRGESLKFVQRDAREYECLRKRSATRWSCEWQQWEDIGRLLTATMYDEQAALAKSMPPHGAAQRFISSATVNGIPVTCLRYEMVNAGSRATWCITARGITAFAVAIDVGTVEMVKLSPVLPRSIFALPARPGINSFVPSPPSSVCQSSQIEARQGPRTGGATGERALLITLTNKGRGVCALDGYPRVRFVGTTGKVLKLPQVKHSQYVTTAGPNPVLLGVGATAYVLVAQYRCDLGYLDQAVGARLTLPGAAARTALTVRAGSIPLPLAVCRGGATSPGNVIAVTPVESTIEATVP
jgi:uncharacterized protein DUF4232